MDDFQARRESLTVVNVIAAANVAVFLLWLMPAAPLEFMAGHFLVSWLHLMDGRLWVLVTSVFSHNMMFHLLINMIVLLSFGPPLERLMGSSRFLLFYLVAGVTGSFAHAAVSNFLIGTPQQAALGASSALAGVLLLFALSFPKARVLLFFIIPLPAIVAALAFIAIDIWGLVAQIEGQGLPIGHGAHLGGALVGILYYVTRGRAMRLQGRDLPV
jgi:membrane associated rhomboid family serine protease